MGITQKVTHMVQYCIIAVFCLAGVTLGRKSLVSNWSNWATCSGNSNDKNLNCISRTLLCQFNKTNEPQVCRHGNASVEEELYNCTACDGDWINENNQTCIPTCYSSSKWETSVCSTNSTCQRRSRIPCNDLALCSAVWTKTSASACNSSCNMNGSKAMTERCLKDNQESIECSDSYGFLTTRTIFIQCTNKECNAWSKWSIAGACSQSCGGGSISRSRRCLDSSGCAQPKEMESEERTCNNFSCPAWSSWAQGRSCQNGVRAVSRICLHMGSLSHGCNETDGEYLESLLISCNSKTNETLFTDTNDCNKLLLTFTIPLVVGLVMAFFLVIATAIFVYLKCKKKRFSTKDIENSNTMKSSHGRYDKMNGNAHNIHSRKSEVIPYIMPVKDADAAKNGDRETPTNKSLSSLSTTSQERSFEDQLSNEDSVPRISRTEFHRYGSFPDIAEEEKKKEEAPSDQYYFKPRPSVRRAEIMRKREQQRERKRSRVKQEEEGDMAWRRTQTLRMPSPQPEDLETPANSEQPSRHRRARSAGTVLDTGFVPTSFTPAGKSVKTLQNSTEEFSPKGISLKPIKPQRNSIRKTTLPTLFFQGEEMCIGRSFSNNAAPRLRTRSDSGISKSTSHLADNINRNRAESTRIMMDSTRRLRQPGETQRPSKPKRNPSFRGASFDGNLPKFRSTNFLHPSLSLHENYVSPCHSRSLHSVLEDNTKDNENKHRSSAL